MKVVILAGGLGSRISEETIVKPKPLVEIGGKPIIWHIMKLYSVYGFTEFCVALGYKGRHIKEFFLSYCSNVSIDLSEGRIIDAQRPSENWIIHLIETGQDTQTGGRIKRMKPVVGNETFMATYGDGVCLIYGSYTFVESGTGRPLRYPETQTNDSGATVQNANDEQALTPEGQGAIAEFPFAGTGFHVGDGFVLTNRHVTQPWEADERAQSLNSSVRGIPRCCR